MLLYYKQKTLSYIYKHMDFHTEECLCTGRHFFLSIPLTALWQEHTMALNSLMTT